MCIKDKVLERTRIIDTEELQANQVLGMVHSLRMSFDENEFVDLLSLIFIVQNINYQIKECLIKGNPAFCDYDDYFSEFIRIVYETIFSFDDNIGNFVSNVGMNIRNSFKNLRKNDYFKLKGNLKKDDPRRKQRKVITLDCFENQIGYAVSLDQTVLIEEIHNCIEELPEYQRDIINYQYFSLPNRKRTDKEVLKHFNMKQSQLSYVLRIIKQRLYNMGICDIHTLEAEYEEDNKITYYKNLELNRTYSDEYVTSNNLWFSNYNCYA